MIWTNADFSHLDPLTLSVRVRISCSTSEGHLYRDVASGLPSMIASSRAWLISPFSEQLFFYASKGAAALTRMGARLDAMRY
jgi:hypothetical protein